MIASGIAIASRAMSRSSPQASARRSRDSRSRTLVSAAVRIGSSRQLAGSYRRARATMRAGASRRSGSAGYRENRQRARRRRHVRPTSGNDGMRPSTGSMRGRAFPTAGRHVVISSG